MKLLCVKTKNKNINSICEIRALPDEEYESYLAALDDFNNLEKKISLFNMCFINYQDFNLYINEIMKIYMGESYLEEPEIKFILSKLNCKLNNFLSSMRTFLDHSERILKKEYGKNSEEVKNFKELTNRLYDSHFSYRFLYKLRNYAQHNGLGITHFNISKEYGVDNNINIESIISLNRDLILDDFKWNPITKDIQNQPEEIYIKPLMDQMILDLRCLLNFIIKKELIEIKNSFVFLNKLIEEASVKEGIPCIVKYYDGKNLNLSWFPLELLNLYKFLIDNLNN